MTETPGGVDGTPYGQNGWMDNDQDGVMDETLLLDGVDVLPGTPIPILKARQPSELVILSESFLFPGSQKTGWIISGPNSPVEWRVFPGYRHKQSGFPIGFLDGHAASFRAVENELTITNRSRA